MDVHRDEADNTEGRVKSAMRMRYEAEVQFLKRQNGELELVRQKLGLSRRKICHLLLVDPSAWTRWTKGQGEAPPHIYRALDWYISLMEKDPEYRRLSHRLGDWLNRDKNFEGRLASLELRLEKPKPVQVRKAAWISLATAVIILLFTFFRSWF